MLPLIPPPPPPLPHAPPHPAPRRSTVGPPPRWLLPAPPAPPPMRPCIHHHPAHIDLRTVAPPDPLPPRPRPRQRRLHQILGQRPVTGQQPRCPLQGVLACLDELREPLDLSIHCFSGHLDPSINTTT